MVLRCAIAALALLSAAAMPAALAKPFAEVFPGKAIADEKTRDVMSALDYQLGAVALGSVPVKLTLPDGYIFVAAVDAIKLLQLTSQGEEIKLPGLLGAILPRDATSEPPPWIATLAFAKSTHVMDSDVANVDFAPALKRFSKRLAGNKHFGSLKWAGRPGYDVTTHTLHLPFEAVESGAGADEIVNLNVVEGNEESLEIVLSGALSAKPAIAAALPQVLAMASFDRGHRYEDYDVPVLDDGHEPTLEQLQNEAMATAAVASASAPPADASAESASGSATDMGGTLRSWIGRLHARLGAGFWALIGTVIVGLIGAMSWLVLAASRSTDRVLPAAGAARATGSTSGAAVDRLASLQSRQR